MNKITTIPFGGFYESIATHLLDNEFDNLLEKQADEGVTKHDNTPLNSDDLTVDNKGYKDQYSKGYIDVYNQAFDDTVGVELGLAFESLESPTFYNFETDRIFAYISLQKVKELLSSIDGVELAGFILDRFTSRSGFTSFYSNDLVDWINKTLKDWDCNEVGTLLDFCLNSQDMINYELDQLSEIAGGYVEVNPEFLAA
ncbi:MAG: hypothetical protein JKY93_02165 [Gammaproteobacteria bacterium]|nr:hypothetical protein [Gammaproteobacteria bacterium]